MERKRLITIGVAALILTIGTGEAFGAMIKASTTTSNEDVITQVTKPVMVIDSDVKQDIVLSGPIQALELAAGPIFTSDPPIVGSIDWMAQEKAEKDKLKSDHAKTQAELEAEIARLEKIAFNTKTLNETLALVKKQVGKTPWVFSGSTPRAWDCSGLVMWTYSYLGVDLKHSASAQKFAGEFVDEPKIGDIVSFNHQNYGSAYHVGIYIGPDEMIHAGGKPGDRTEIRSIKGWSKDNGGSEITYTRIIETNN